eukprot:gene25478-biopygen13522
MGPMDGCDPEDTGNHQKCRDSCRVLWRRSLWRATRRWRPAPKAVRSTASSPYGGVFQGVYSPPPAAPGRPALWAVLARCSFPSRTASAAPRCVVGRGGMEWDAEEVIFEAFWNISPAFWPPKLAKSGLKHAPQRREYTRSLPMGPIDGTYDHFRV